MTPIEFKIRPELWDTPPTKPPPNTQYIDDRIGRVTISGGAGRFTIAAVGTPLISVDQHVSHYPIGFVNPSTHPLTLSVENMALAKLESLNSDPDDLPSDTAMTRARFFVQKLFATSISSITDPEFLVNVGPGIDMVWECDDRHVQVHFPATADEQDYVFFNDENGSFLEKDPHPSRVLELVKRIA